MCQRNTRLLLHLIEQGKATLMRTWKNHELLNIFPSRPPISTTVPPHFSGLAKNSSKIILSSRSCEYIGTPGTGTQPFDSIVLGSLLNPRRFCSWAEANERMEAKRKSLNILMVCKWLGGWWDMKIVGPRGKDSHHKNIIVSYLLCGHSGCPCRLVTVFLMTIWLWGPRHHNIIIIICTYHAVILDILAGYHVNYCPRCPCRLSGQFLSSMPMCRKSV